MADPSMDTLMRDLLKSNSSVHVYTAYHARAGSPVSF